MSHSPSSVHPTRPSSQTIVAAGADRDRAMRATLHVPRDQISKIGSSELPPRPGVPLSNFAGVPLSSSASAPSSFAGVPLSSSAGLRGLEPSIRLPRSPRTDVANDAEPRDKDPLRG